MKLLVVSHTPHYLLDGVPAGWASTVREIDQLAQLFESVTHLAVLYPGSAPQNSIGYRAKNIQFLPVKPAGGESWKAKPGILLAYPQYWLKLQRAISQLDEHDCIHVRCPANLSLLSICWLAITSRPRYRWVKYAGNWQPADPQPLSYRFQRWWLKRNFHRGTVTVNGKWPQQEPHVFSFLNPSFSLQEVRASRRSVLTKQLGTSIRLLFIGRVEEAKGTGRVIEIARILHERGIKFQVDIVGDGERLSAYQAEVKRLMLDGSFLFHGWLNRDDLAALYAQAHFLVLPSASEGWPKVLSEGMSYGVVPLAGAVSSIPQILKDFQTGKALDTYDPAGFERAILGYLADPDQWKAESLAGIEAAKHFTYEHYLEQVRGMFQSAWGVNLSLRTEA
jgi:glycosyltransferase involved in cell wall biosynthesis